MTTLGTHLMAAIMLNCCPSETTAVTQKQMSLHVLNDDSTEAYEAVIANT
jgi:hypothetical protein